VTKQFSIDPARLRKNPWNPNFTSPENEAKLAASIKELGLFKPIVVRELYDLTTDTDFEILGGEHRWDQAKAAGHATVPVFSVGVIDDATAKKISLADNARYGADDTFALAKVLEDLKKDNLQEILPYTETDLSAIFSSANIALDELDLPDGFEDEKIPDEPRATKAPKTHTIMRFKVPVADAERITELIAKIQKREGFTTSDELTNAGDALSHLLLSGKGDE
jgi:ParB-like chromosome segregation protein Spo0J